MKISLLLACLTFTWYNSIPSQAMENQDTLIRVTERDKNTWTTGYIALIVTGYLKKLVGNNTEFTYESCK